LALAAVMLALAVAGGALAASSGGTKTIIVCVKKKGGELYRAKKCGKAATKLTWNQTGPQGLRGVQGVQGPPGDPGNDGTNGIGAERYPYSSTGGTDVITDLGPLELIGLCNVAGGGTPEYYLGLSSTSAIPVTIEGQYNAADYAVGTTPAPTSGGSGTAYVLSQSTSSPAEILSNGPGSNTDTGQGSGEVTLSYTVDGTTTIDEIVFNLFATHGVSSNSCTGQVTIYPVTLFQG
jgi:hypothetical protein